MKNTKVLFIYLFKVIDVNCQCTGRWFQEKYTPINTLWCKPVHFGPNYWVYWPTGVLQT